MGRTEIESNLWEKADEWKYMPREIKYLVDLGFEAVTSWQQIGGTGLYISQTLDYNIGYIDFGPGGIYDPPTDDRCDRMLIMARNVGMFAVGMCEYIERMDADSISARKLIGLTNFRMANFLCKLFGEAASCYRYEVDDYDSEVWVVLDLAAFKSDSDSMRRVKKIAKVAKKRWGWEMGVKRK